MPFLKRAVQLGRKYQNPVETTVGGPGMILKILPLYLSNKEERVPRQPLGPFQTDVQLYQRPPVTGLRITWMGHSSMLIEIDGVRVLIDPVWDQRASPVSFAGPKRFYAPPVRLEDLPPLDVILISHDHYDHLGKQTIRKLSQSQVAWVTSLGVARQLTNFGVPKERITELNWTESFQLANAQPASNLTITALPARHFSGRKPWDRFETLWSSFVLKGSRHNVYYGADSGMWDGFSEMGREHGPFQLTMLEIGAYNHLWESIHMGPDGAAKAFLDLGASGLLMPIHWGLFDLALHAWRQPIRRIVELSSTLGIKLWSPAPGLPTDVIAGQEHRSSWYE